jgi:hypothetical protein
MSEIFFLLLAAPQAGCRAAAAGLRPGQLTGLLKSSYLFRKSREQIASTPQAP